MSFGGRIRVIVDNVKQYVWLLRLINHSLFSAQRLKVLWRLSSILVTWFNSFAILQKNRCANFVRVFLGRSHSFYNYKNHSSTRSILRNTGVGATSRKNHLCGFRDCIESSFRKPIIVKG